MPTDNVTSYHAQYHGAFPGILNDAIFLDAAAPLLEPRRLCIRLPDITAGGVDALLATAGALEGCSTTMRAVAEWLAIERAQNDRICIARGVADIRSAKALGKTAVVLHFQGADPIEDNVDLLNAFHACGLRVMQLTYNARNRIGDGCFEPSDIGLSGSDGA
jgi:membrane dipeptidase